MTTTSTAQKTQAQTSYLPNNFSEHFRAHTISLLSGAVSGFITIMVGHPLDTIKVRMQMNNIPFNECSKFIYQKEGFFAFYKGVALPLTTLPMTRAINLSIFDLVLRHGFSIKDRLPSYKEALIAGMVTGSFSSLMSAPIEIVKVRLQMEAIGQKAKLTNAWSMLKNIYHENGLRQLYRGYLATFGRDFTWCLNLSAFYGIRNILDQYWGEKKVNMMIAGSLAGVLSWPVAYPFDTLKTRMQTVNGVSYRDIFKKIKADSGYRGFFHGLGASMVRAPIVSAISLFTFEESKRHFNCILPSF